MPTSQNGWSAGSKTAIGGLDNRYVPGTKVRVAPGVRKGDAATVLFYVAEQFNLHVEKLKPGWCWGYNYRGIRGATSLSNHASGTAIDLNAPTHGLGATGTFTEKQLAAIRKILAFCEGVVRAGVFYKGRPDPMHFELVGTPAQVARIARKIRALNEPKASIPKPVAPAKPITAPAKPAALAVDGDLGPTTVQRWHQVMGLAVSGKVDAVLVKAVQGRLGVKVDGDLGPITIKALQRRLDVKADGDLGPTTVKALQRRLNTGKF
ncbi:peptidoglycan hydrolase-like protein with peptidoglycan-binding domain [Actinoplanes campanulatus]|uniref:Peptidoglycan hydrolase-like protein with peptidoglycan-binding domain n=1 Tax=Actinoplanes campanulatus TaxID=113559 RepID=A0A7W5AP29_9ACTN|nr:M15 family metallopeptidase [Actinoplanes campanulatus]MBB3099409.1 peptidoglycan hydrolase-like protein with peptidoglycan-binding domain [Actinoplanes campanulatus]